MMEIKTDFDFNFWTACVWIERDYFHASGNTKEEAKENLLEHLKGIVPIYENDIAHRQRMLAHIKELTE
jgi:predicted RNase H-like HicB family nuclease